ncbi:MAG: hypothetical protein IJG50_03425 [Clostridia bacterium]|nr:hypothetical protein [Clostridia bacterium]
MEREFHISHTDGDLALYVSLHTGITIRKPPLKDGAQKSLFKNAKGSIDVCMSESGAVFIIAQTKSGVITKIIYKNGAWRRFDVLIPKTSGYYEKSFALCPHNGEVYALFSVKSAEKYALCMTPLKKSGHTPSLLSYISSWDAFAAVSNENVVCAVFEDEKGVLKASFFSAKRERAYISPLLSGAGASQIRALLKKDTLYAAFLKSGRLFLIETDIRKKRARAIHDLSDAPPDTEISLCEKRGAPVIHTVLGAVVFTFEFDPKSRRWRKTTESASPRAPHEIKHVYAGGSETELII